MVWYLLAPLVSWAGSGIGTVKQVWALTEVWQAGLEARDLSAVCFEAEVWVSMTAGDEVWTVMVEV